MGVLVRIADGTRIVLPSRALLGRSPDSTVVLADRLASSHHARLVWTGSAWEVRDLGSRNGTFINGAMIPTGAPRLLAKGDRLGFGELDGGWLLEETGSPAPMAIDLSTKQWVEGVGDLLQLPGSDSPEVTVYRAQSGVWQLEDASGVRDTSHQEVVTLGGRTFRLELPDPSDLTPVADVSFSLHNVTVRFHVPSSYERVALELVHSQRHQFLEPREHSFLLLVLARERLADRQLPEEERGWRTTKWVESTMKMDGPAVNVLIHRARLQLASAGLEAAAEIVEVKRGGRRFGSDRIEIIPDAGR